MKQYTALLLAVLAFISCTSPSIRDSSTVQKVDGKIQEEFYEAVRGGDFYAASRGYILSLIHI